MGERKGRGALSWAWDQSVCTADMQAMVDNVVHKSPAAVGGEVARNQALKISRLFHEKMKTMVEI